MFDQYQDSEDDSYSNEGNGGRSFNNNAGTRTPGYPDSEAEDEFPHYTDSRYTYGQSSFVEDALFWTENAGDSPPGNYSVPMSGPEHHTNSPMDLDVSDQLPQLEGNSVLMENIGGDIPYEFDAVASPRFTENMETIHFPDFGSSGQHPHLKSNPFLTEYISGDESYEIGAGVGPRFEENRDAQYFTDFSASCLTPQSEDGAAFSGGAGGQSPHRYAETIDDTNHNPGYSLHANMMPQSAVGPEWGYNDQDTSQSNDGHNNISPVSNQSKKLPPQLRMSRAGEKWTDDETEKLLDWSEAGMRSADIGEKLNRTANSCRSHLRDVKLKMDQAEKEANSAPWAPKHVPLLCANGTGPVNWKTPGLKEWVHRRKETIRKIQNGGPAIVAWHIVAKDLNKANHLNLGRNDYRRHLGR